MSGIPADVPMILEKRLGMNLADERRLICDTVAEHYFVGSSDLDRDMALAYLHGVILASLER